MGLVGDPESIAVSLGGASVPDTIGDKPSTAISKIQGVGPVSRRLADTPVTDFLESGKVVSQTPAADQTVATGTTAFYSVGVFHDGGL